ncbi:FKBP-type peptidyl-prolyl cis-trans isomerase [Algoriphagus zhangzhouensis]|jgi:peptidylprolyl isomerase|uniref:Peptidyl-prolyl cis-trans isomerase n=1 Tax=Algoriphagus zhangzhouensis TaxID=1073327 RepID=A0A1M7ZDJ0_9BACT|nr:peptidylprolyl isomerase [Algoriphagus zhangzhouensis]TDY45819.1 peptidylprolyl isomerase [Algoriphagus zhangzhouensis]SHO62947.1 peptidylprolyl isomerase [Algoriphagus zhangzhouensis]
MQAKKGDNVQVHYTGKLEDGSVFDSSVQREPLGFTVGGGQMIQGFDAAVNGMAVGDKKTVTIPAAEAYGERRDDMLIDVPRTQVPADIKPEIGMQLTLQGGNGQPMPVIVIHVDDEKITLDANHQLAGKDLIFDIELVKIG